MRGSHLLALALVIVAVWAIVALALSHWASHAVNLSGIGSPRH